MTPRQSAVFNFIGDFWNKKGYGPSYQEVADACGIGSRAGVHHVVKSLLRRRLIEHGKGMRRWLIPIRSDLLKRRKFAPGTMPDLPLQTGIDTPVNRG